MGWDRRQFKKLVDSEGCTFEFIEKGETIVEPNNPLNEVILIHKGEAAAENPLSKEVLYTYRGDGCNGCVIGGTALVDNTVRLKAYPNRIVAATDSTVVRWNTDHLAEVMHEDKEIESAVLHALYVELIQGLRRERQHKHEKEIHANIVDKLQKLESMVKQAIAKSENNKFTLFPQDKKAVREFILKNRITTAQKENILSKFGWSSHHWEDGSLHH
jgi:CRP-like cAMP-binding protein